VVSFLQFTHSCPVHIHLLPSTCHMSHSSHSRVFDQPNNILRAVRITNNILRAVRITNNILRAVRITNNILRTVRITNNILRAVRITNRHFVQFFCNLLSLPPSKVQIPSPTPYYRAPSTKEHDHRQQGAPNSQLPTHRTSLHTTSNV